MTKRNARRSSTLMHRFEGSYKNTALRISDFRRNRHSFARFWAQMSPKSAQIQEKCQCGMINGNRHALIAAGRTFTPTGPSNNLPIYNAPR